MTEGKWLKDFQKKYRYKGYNQIEFYLAKETLPHFAET